MDIDCPLLKNAPVAAPVGRARSHVSPVPAEAPPLPPAPVDLPPEGPIPGPPIDDPDDEDERDIVEPDGNPPRRLQRE